MVELAAAASAKLLLNFISRRKVAEVVRRVLECKLVILRAFFGPRAICTLALRSLLYLVRQHGGRTAELSVCVSGPETALRSGLFPDLAGKELAEAVEFEARRLIPFPADDSIFDYRVVEKIRQDNETKVRVAMLAATGAAAPPRPGSCSA